MTHKNRHITTEALTPADPAYPILYTATEVARLYFGGARRRIYRAQARDVNPFPQGREIAGRSTFLAAEIETWLREELERNERGDVHKWPAVRSKGVS